MDEIKNTQDPFVSAMGASSSSSSTVPAEEQKSTNVSKVEYAVDSSAETVVHTVAEVLKWIGLIGGTLSAIIGICLLGEYGTLGVILIGSGIVSALSGIISWAFLRLLVNISRNLFRIYDLLKKIDKGE